MTLLPFAIGCIAAFAWVLHVLHYRYQGLPRRFDESRADHLRLILNGTDWSIVVVIVLLGGVVGLVLWYGLNDIWRVMP